VEVPVVAAPLMQESAPAAVTPRMESAVAVEPIAPRAAPAAPAAPAASAARPSTAPERPATSPTATERMAPRDSRPGVDASRDSPIFDNRKAQSPPAPPTGDAPRIDLDAARARARAMAKEGTGNRALLPFPMPPAPERKTKEQTAIEKAWKPDCKDAYKDLGLLAVVPLIANEFGEGSCRW
jgi:hypothetical protein